MSNNINDNNKSLNKYNNTYELHITNDSNYTIVPEQTSYCLKCGNDLKVGSLDQFCDFGCRREYYAEIRHDLRGFEG